MNDRFKFRVWDKRQNKYIESPEPTPLLQANGLLAYFKDEKPMENYVIQFCTGLKDKNGTLIYEGDIVEYKPNGDKCEIIFDQYQYMAKVYMLDDIVPITELLNDFGKCPFEVIGNIYENKSLLESEVEEC